MNIEKQVLLTKLFVVDECLQRMNPDYPCTCTNRFQIIHSTDNQLQFYSEKKEKRKNRPDTKQNKHKTDIFAADFALCNFYSDRFDVVQ